MLAKLYQSQADTIVDLKEFITIFESISHDNESATSINEQIRQVTLNNINDRISKLEDLNKELSIMARFIKDTHITDRVHMWRFKNPQGGVKQYLTDFQDENETTMRLYWSLINKKRSDYLRLANVPMNVS